MADTSATIATSLRTPAQRVRDCLERCPRWEWKHCPPSVEYAIISMAKALNLRVVAEGVETLQQCEILKTMGCDELQGYLFSTPIPAADMLKLVMSPPKGRGTPDFSHTLYDVTVPMELS